MTTKILEFPKVEYILTSNDDLFHLNNDCIIQLDLEGKENFKYRFKHTKLILKLESNHNYIFIKSKMPSNNDLLLLTVFEKQIDKVHSIYCNFRKISIEENYIFLYGENEVDNKTIHKNTSEIINGDLELGDKYQQILESKEYIDADNSDYSVIACSHDENVFILCTDNYDTWSTVYMNDLEINSFVVLPYFVEREEGIFYQNDEFEWYYNDILLDQIKGNNPQFGNQYILDIVEGITILYKMNSWDKCDRCNIKIPEHNKCDFCKIKLCKDCKGDNITFYHCETCNKYWCIRDTISTDTYCEENRRSGNGCIDCGH